MKSKTLERLYKEDEQKLIFAKLKGEIRLKLINSTCPTDEYKWPWFFRVHHALGITTIHSRDYRIVGTILNTEDARQIIKEFKESENEG